MAIAVSLMVAGCASGGAPSGTVDWDAQLDLGAPGDRIDSARDVRYYPACGNETLTFEGEEWHPFEPANPDDFPAVPVAVPSEALGDAPASAVFTAVSLPAVVEPGPGDDVGTLMRFEGGFAHWASASGGLETWLTTTELEYGWVC